MARTLGAWDCEYCGTKKMWGNEFDCKNCGRPRSRGVRFYLPDDAPEVTPEIAEQLGSGDPNWYCNHCDSGNKDDNTHCWNCGALEGTSPEHEVREYSEGETPETTREAQEADDDDKSWVDFREQEEDRSVRNQTHSAIRPTGGALSLPHSFRDISGSSRKGIFTITGVVLGLAVLAFAAYQFFFNTHEELVTVSGFDWSQSVTVQEYQAFHESSWSTHPTDAYNVLSVYKDTGRDQKIHDGYETVPYQDTCYKPVEVPSTCTRQVFESKTCDRDNGDGSFTEYECGGNVPEPYSCTKTEQEPYSCTKERQEELYHYEDIEDWYYEYDINKWITINTFPTSGTDHNPFYYSDFSLKNPYNGSGVPQLGQRQKFEEPGTYGITFFCEANTGVGNDGYFSQEYPFSDWKNFFPGIDYPIEVNVFDKILSNPVP